MGTKIKIIITLLIVNTMVLSAQNQHIMIPPFNNETAVKLAAQALSCINDEYPCHLNFIATNTVKISSPKEFHPSFYGCYHWYSSVKAHWILVKLLHEFPDLEQHDNIISMLNQTLSYENVNKELENFEQHFYFSDVRPYGWAWVLKLTSELANTQNEQEKAWFKHLFPLAETIKKAYYDYLPSLYYPVRRGSRSNTALGIAFALDYAKALDDKTFEEFLKERAKFYYFNDRNIPASWEPEGEDLLSPSLIEAELMRKVLPQSDFVRWFKNFLPEIPFTLTHPAVVTNRNQLYGVSLDGLNLSRAWCMFELAKALPHDSQTHRDLWQAGYRHAAEALNNVLATNQPETIGYNAYALLMYLSIANIEQ